MKFLLLLVLWAIFLPITAAVYMLFAGWIHNNFIPGVNPIGYATAIQLCLWTSLLTLLYGFGKAIGEAVAES